MNRELGDIIENIRVMEARLNRSRELLDRLEADFAELRALRPEMDKLFDYYGSERWFADRELDRDGLLEGIARGVLGEDYVYDALTDYIRLMREIREFCENEPMLKEK